MATPRPARTRMTTLAHTNGAHSDQRVAVFQSTSNSEGREVRGTIVLIDGDLESSVSSLLQFSHARQVQQC